MLCKNVLNQKKISPNPPRIFIRIVVDDGPQDHELGATAFDESYLVFLKVQSDHICTNFDNPLEIWSHFYLTHGDERRNLFCHPNDPLNSKFG